MKNMKLVGVGLAAALAVAACGGDGGAGGSQTTVAGTPSLTVPKAITCGSGDRPETGLQGQVPAALRQAGFDGFSCNLKLVGQYAGEGGNWSSATHRDKAGRNCAYHSTASPIAPVGQPYSVLPSGQSLGRVNPGVPVIDITDPANPLRTMSLTTPAMIEPWESLRVNASRQLLIADNGGNGGLSGGPQIDIYDVSLDCRSPQLMASAEIGTGTDGGIVSPTKPLGHEGNISPDGLTYYVGDLFNNVYRAVDVTDSSKPKLIADFDMKTAGVGSVHGLSVSQDGNRIYVASNNIPTPAEVQSTTAPLRNGFLILDTSEVQARKPNATIKPIASVVYKDGSGAQHTIETKINGKPYLVMVDEGGSGGPDPASAKLACNAKLPPFPMARIYDISDETKPVLVSKLMLETQDPANCDQVLPDIVGLSLFTYGSHYCSVDNRNNATALACSFFNSGVRVFDIREPAKPKEIAYYNPAGAKVQKPGSSHPIYNSFRAGAPDWCASRSDFDFDRRMLTTMCQDNGLIVLQFAEGTWPFPESTPSTLQN
ncbi:hypothetical protein D9M68_120930 [compost metagenome]